MKKWRVRQATPDMLRLKHTIDVLGADPYALNMWAKGVAVPLLVQDVKVGAANVIKQEALASGMDAAVPRGTVNGGIDRGDVLLLGTVRGLRILSGRLKRQGFSLPFLAAEIDALLDKRDAPAFVMRGKKLSLHRPVVMGILNTTPDSFSDGGSYMTPDAVSTKAKDILAEGGTFIDIGGVSTRPGFEMPGEAEELERVLPAVKLAARLAGGAFISVDTMRASVAEKALAAGADMVNDQDGLRDPAMAELCARYGAGVCLMYRPDEGYAAETPMKCVDEVLNECARMAERAENTGIARENICLDPGFGFGKSFEDGYAVLQYLDELCSLGYPVLAGVSRKSMIGAAVKQPVQERTFGTLAAETIAAMKGAAIIRTHDVRACAEALLVLHAAGGGYDILHD